MFPIALQSTTQAPASESSLSRKALIERLRTWESIVSLSPDAVCINNREGCIEYVNAAFEQLFGYRAEAIIGQNLGLLDTRITPSLASQRLPGFDHGISLSISRRQGSWQGEVLACRQDGAAIPVRISMIRHESESGDAGGQVSTFVDLSETRRRERQLETLRSIAEDLSARLDLDDLFEHALRAAVSLTDADFAALAIPDAARTTFTLSHHTPIDDPTLAELVGQAYPLDGSTAGAALHAGREIRLDECQTQASSRDPLRQLGAHCALAYPINLQDRNPIVLCIANLSRVRDFDDEAIQLIATIARQIGVAVERERLIREARASSRQLDEIIHRNPDAILITDDAGVVRFTNPAAQRLLAREERELNGFRLGLTSQMNAGELDVHRPQGDSVPVELHAMETTWEGARAHVLTLRDLTDRRLAENERRASADRIHRALVQTIEAISRTVETRDPYTAGHQRRVAAIGREIARVLQLAQETIDAVYMGGMIHDIGKLYIPAEILNRPGELNDIEFLLIRTHCSVGSDIIKGIEFPWPLAMMIQQHHERMDGSGYPRGLRGKQILLEARILAVADVVDAMSSRRPYREPLGLDAALTEINHGRGVRFDESAADACVQLFEQGQLTLEALQSDI